MVLWTSLIMSVDNKTAIIREESVVIATDLKLLQIYIKEVDTVKLNLQIKKHWELPKSGLNS